MKIKIFFVSFLCLLSLQVDANSRQAFYQKFSKQVVQEISLITPPQTILVEKFNKDTRNTLAKEMRAALHKANYQIPLSDELSKITNELLKMQDPLYDNEKSPQVGKFIPPKMMISGEVNYQEKQRLGKKRTNTNVHIKLIDLEKACIVYEKNETHQTDNQPPINFYYLCVALLCFLAWLINAIFKAYYGKIIFLTCLGLIIIVSLWYFLV